MTCLEASSFSILDVQSFIRFTSDDIAEALSEIFRLILCTSSACSGSFLANASTPPSKLSGVIASAEIRKQVNPNNSCI